MSENQDSPGARPNPEDSPETFEQGNLRATIDQLSERNAVLLAAIEAAGGAAYQVESGTNRAVFIGTQIESLTGYPDEELTDEVWAEMLHFTDGASVHPSALRAPFHVLMPSSSSTAYEIRTKRGDILWLSNRSKELTTDDGTVVGAVGMLQDISGAVSAQHQIREQYARLTALRTIDVAILSYSELRDTLTVVLNQVLSLLDVDAAAILLLNRQSSELVYAAGMGLRTEPDLSAIPVGTGVVGIAAQAGGLTMLSDVPEGEPDPYRYDLIAREGFVDYFADR